MATKPSIEKEAKKWDAMPFSFDPSPKFQLAMRKRVEAYRAGKKPKPKTTACMCQACGSVLIVGPARDYKKKKVHPETYCDKECAEADRSRIYRTRRVADKTVLSKGLMPSTMASKVCFCNCVHCKRRFASHAQKQFCSNKCTQCYRDAVNLKNQFKLQSERIEVRRKNAKLQSCKQCGTQYTSLVKSGKLYCSRRCVQKYAKKNREHIARSSRKIGGGFSDTEVFEAAKWTCKLCGIKVHRATGKHSETQATIDHIVPMSKGGLHVWGNVQCACQRCNASKSDKIEMAVQMLFL